MNEVLVYIVDTDIKDDVSKLADKDFASIAETNGSVYSLNGFQEYWNRNKGIYLPSTNIRFINKANIQ